MGFEGFAEFAHTIAFFSMAHLTGQGFGFFLRRSFFPFFALALAVLSRDAMLAGADLVFSGLWAVAGRPG